MSLSFSHLVVEPDDGIPPVLDFISSAEKTLLIKQFTFSEPSLMQAVAERKTAGSRCAILNPKRSGGDRANDETYDYFKKNGVNIRWANPKFYVTHEKSIVVDGKARSLRHSICGEVLTQTRDYGVVTHDRSGAQVIEGLRRTGHRDWLPDRDRVALLMQFAARMSHLRCGKHRLVSSIRSLLMPSFSTAFSCG
jgi:hypothetical protein